jgi:hypothetical protein
MSSLVASDDLAASGDLATQISQFNSSFNPDPTHVENLFKLRSLDDHSSALIRALPITPMDISVLEQSPVAKEWIESLATANKLVGVTGNSRDAFIESMREQRDINSEKGTPLLGPDIPSFLVDTGDSYVLVLSRYAEATLEGIGAKPTFDYLRSQGIHVNAIVGTGSTSTQIYKLNEDGTLSVVPIDMSLDQIPKAGLGVLTGKTVLIVGALGNASALNEDALLKCKSPAEVYNLFDIPGYKAANDAFVDAVKNKSGDVNIKQQTLLDTHTLLLPGALESGKLICGAIPKKVLDLKLVPRGFHTNQRALPQLVEVLSKLDSSDVILANRIKMKDAGGNWRQTLFKAIDILLPGVGNITDAKEVSSSQVYSRANPEGPWGEPDTDKNNSADGLLSNLLGSNKKKPKVEDGGGRKSKRNRKSKRRNTRKRRRRTTFRKGGAKYS